MKNSVDPDLLASNEASRSGFSVFFIHMMKPAALNLHIFYILKCHSQKEVVYRNVLEAVGQQCRPRLDCSCRSHLSCFDTVCLCTDIRKYIKQRTSADNIFGAGFLLGQFSVKRL